MLKKLFVWGNVVLLLLFLAAVVKDLAGPWFPGRWAHHQKTYRRMQAEGESAEAQQAIRSRPIEIKQILANEIGQIDRCISCHQGMDPLATPTLQNNFDQNPYKSHPGDFLKHHPVDQFGCVSCHGGQGIATTFYGAAHTPKSDAQKAEWKKKHGWHPTKHWERPMLAPPFIQASCAKCHGNLDTLAGAEVAALGKQKLAAHGCYGCHQWKGWGGPISVDLAEETANKPLGRIDFSHTGLKEEDMNLLNWVYLHFVKDPGQLVPGDPEAKFNTEPIAPSGMPDFTQPSLAHPDRGPELKEADAMALTTFILSGQAEKIPHTFYVPGPPAVPFERMNFSSRIQAGKWVYERYGCAGCHGLDAKGGRRNFNYMGGVEPALVKTVGNYTREELLKKIVDGVTVVDKENPKGPTPPLYMPPWKDKISPKEMDALLDYLFSIAEKQEEF